MPDARMPSPIPPAIRDRLQRLLLVVLIAFAGVTVLSFTGELCVAPLF